MPSALSSSPPHRLAGTVNWRPHVELPPARSRGPHSLRKRQLRAGTGSEHFHGSFGRETSLRGACLHISADRLNARPCWLILSPIHLLTESSTVLVSCVNDGEHYPASCNASGTTIPNKTRQMTSNYVRSQVRMTILQCFRKGRKAAPRPHTPQQPCTLPASLEAHQPQGRTQACPALFNGHSTFAIILF